MNKIVFVYVKLNFIFIIKLVIQIHLLIDILNNNINQIGIFIDKEHHQQLVIKLELISKITKKKQTIDWKYSFSFRGLDITFNSLNDSSYGGILIRSIENKQTGQIYEGSCLVVDALLNLCNSKTIKELVEKKLNQNLSIFNKNSFIYLRSLNSKTNQELLASPRVGLTLKIPSIIRERFLFRSYRFTPEDYYPSKMKTTILLSLAAQKYFNNTNKKFTDFINDISIETNTRLSTVKNNLNDLQNGYDADITKKTSPLVDYYKKNLTTSDLVTAYGIWLRTYRSN